MNDPVAVAVDPAGAISSPRRAGRASAGSDAEGLIGTVAGTDESGYSGDRGPPRRAQMRAPSGVAIDAEGRVLIADRDNERIRRVGDLRPELGTVSRAFASARIGGKPVTTLPGTARRLCATFAFGQRTADGLPIAVVFRTPAGKRFARVPKLPATPITACASGRRHLAAGRWQIVLQVVGRPLRSVAVRVRDVVT